MSLAFPLALEVGPICTPGFGCGGGVTGEPLFFGITETETLLGISTEAHLIKAIKSRAFFASNGGFSFG